MRPWGSFSRKGRRIIRFFRLRRLTHQVNSFVVKSAHHFNAGSIHYLDAGGIPVSSDNYKFPWRQLELTPGGPGGAGAVSEAWQSPPRAAWRREGPR